MTSYQATTVSVGARRSPRNGQHPPALDELGSRCGDCSCIDVVLDIRRKCNDSRGHKSDESREPEDGRPGTARHSPGVEAITFTPDGAVGGGGSWAVNAVVTIDCLEYQEILGLEKWSYGGEPMPTVTRSGTLASVAITYSDGSAEVLR